MKRILPIFSIVLIMTACSNGVDKSADQSNSALQQSMTNYAADTTGLAQFRQWKAQNELAEVSEYNRPEEENLPPKTAKRTYQAPARKTSKSLARNSSPARTTSGTAAEGPGPASGDGEQMSSESGETAKAPQKEGWSKAAKGAVIGGAAGAAGGAVLNKKNRVVGAVIGGVVGAGGGYVLGRKMDKKDGRY
ncbi:MAG TPA: glycine zipper domain-containing protein [Chitinophagaceae bacterium]|nr:glycine zipper domain-containing protein [Chitinophagaceae bacterium]